MDNKSNLVSNSDNKVLNIIDEETKKMMRSLAYGGKIDNDEKLNKDDMFDIADLYFQKNVHINLAHLVHSYNEFIDSYVRRFLKESNHVFYEHYTSSAFIQHKLTFDNIQVIPPRYPNGVDPLFPSGARKNSQSYMLSIVADVKQVKITTNFNNNVSVETVGIVENARHIMTLPTMVGSKYCNKNLYRVDDGCKYDPPGPFIIKGAEKVVICPDRPIYNHPLVYRMNSSNQSFYMVQITSKAPLLSGITQVLGIKIKKDNDMILKMPIFQEMNVMIMFRALGIESDYDIINLCCSDKNNINMIDILKISLDNCLDGNGAMIKTQDDAVEYLISKKKYIKKYDDEKSLVKNEHPIIYFSLIR